MPFADADGVRIYYEVHGEGPAVVLIHGSGGHHAAWWQQTPSLRRAYSVVTLDLRGFGNSDSDLDEFDTLEFPRDIVAVLDDAGLERAALVGQSIGASAALKVGVRHPDRITGVVLAHSLGGIDHDELAALVRADRVRAEELPVLDRLMSKRFQTEHPELTFLFRQMGTFNAAKMADLRNLTAGGPTLDQVAGAGVPICFLAGEHDAVLSPATVRRAHELLPGSLLDVVPGAPHSMYWERPDLFNRALERFLETIYVAEAVATGGE
ncbi:MAG TPA: alpha/beta hydrolase [Solirubrobacteraceae bacterium]|nr:alpha/beta hydrolase [Solirubrobacteraceae bacterium]